MFKTPHIRNKKCCICGKPTHNQFAQYCWTCAVFAHRMKARQYPPKVVKRIWKYVKKYGYGCYYTGMALDMLDTKSPWYCVFDHWAPHNLHKIVITSSLINGMKTNLSEGEFWRFVIRLANYKRYHIKVRRMKLKYWDYSSPLVKVPGNFLGGKILPTRGTGLCAYCGKRLSNKLFTYCPICAKMAIRLHQGGKHYPPGTIEDTENYIRNEGFVCFYTKMKLDMKDPTSPWYCFLNHYKPHDSTKIVLTSALLDVMKGQLTEEEFWYYIEALADYKDKGKEIRKKRPVFWRRLYPVEERMNKKM